MSEREPTPGQAQHHHRKHAPSSVASLVITVSDTRTAETDTGGTLVAELLENAGHEVLGRAIVADEVDAISAALERALAVEETRAVIFTGGTGVAPRDVTPDAIEPRLDRVIPGFGELFRQLSYDSIGSAAMLSRAIAGIVGGRVVFVLPGSRGAVLLGMEKLILPELGHLAGEAVKTR